MSSKIKTSIVIDKNLWEKFKLKVSAEKGLKHLSKAVEEAIEEDLCESIIINALEEMLPDVRYSIEVRLVKPRIETKAEKAIREMRDSRD